jgi:uncharacterized protein
MPGPVNTAVFDRVGCLEPRSARPTARLVPAMSLATAGSRPGKGDAHIVSGRKNKVQATLALGAPASALAEQNRMMAEPVRLARSPEKSR